MIIFILTSISTIFLINTPFILNLFIILFAISTSSLINYLYFSWFSFLIFLIYIGGILVIFIYFSSLIPNQIFKIKNLIPLIFIIPILILFNNNFKFYFNLQPNFINYEFSYIILTHNLTLFFSILIFLFIILLIVVKISSSSLYPIRPIIYAFTNPQTITPLKSN